MSTSTEQRSYRSIGPGKLWFGVGAGPVIWAIYHVLSYALVSVSCHWNFFPFTIFGVAGLSVILLLLTLLLVLVVAYAGLMSYRNWRELREEKAFEGGEPGERMRFMALAGVLLSGLFAVVILVTGVPVLVIYPCTGL